jgi:hypothetical protein
MYWPRFTWFRKLARFCCVPIFLLTFAMAIRTVWIRTNDLFHFGRGQQWWCYAIINYWHVSASMEVYEPGYRGGWVDVPLGKWFFFHVAAGGGIWSVTSRAIVETRRLDCGLFGYRSYEFRGKPVETDVWIDLGPILPICTLLSGGLIAWMLRTTLKTRRLACLGLCPKCGYTLRAPPPGQKCPECGTVIPPRPAAN